MSNLTNRLNSVIAGPTTPTIVKPKVAPVPIAQTAPIKPKGSAGVTKQVSDYGKAMAKASKNTKEYH